MKIIADGGATTKNVASNTRDALILGLNKPYIDGYKFKLYLTKDNEIITLSDDILNFFKRIINEITDLTLREMLLYNVGTRVQKQQVMTLNEVLEIFQNYNKELVLELTNHNEKNALFTDLVLNTISGYPNIDIYLESENQEIVSYLKASTPKKVGIRVTENSRDNWFIDVYFYDIDLTLLDDFNIREKINDNKLVMINRIDTQEIFNQIYNEYSDIFNYIYIITSKIANINSVENLNKR